MNKQLTSITLIILIALLMSCALFGQSNTGLIKVASDNTVTPIVNITPQASPSLQASSTFPPISTPQVIFTQTPKPENTPPSPPLTTSTTVEIGPLSVANQGVVINH